LGFVLFWRKGETKKRDGGREREREIM